MSWKVHETDEVFAALRGLCSNSYRMYDPSEHRSYYDHDCDVYECAVEDAAQEYERLLKHCEKQREELAAIKNPLGRLKEAFMGSIEGASKVRAGSSITDELRECIETAYMARGAREDLLAIADRIDAEHQKAEDEWKAKDGQSWLHGYAECRAELMEGNEVIAASLEDAGWVKLPVDADGAPIHVGDKLTDGEYTFTVCELAAYGGGSWSICNEDGNAWAACDVTHVKPFSWELSVIDAANCVLKMCAKRGGEK